MKKLKIVIANSVGRDEQGNHFIHFPSRWTALIKGERKSFTFYPYELAYLSSLLKKNTSHDIRMIDGNFLQLDWINYFELIKDEKPDYLIMETSSAVYNEDLKLAKKIKEYCGSKIIFTGQHPTALPEDVQKDVDIVCLGEYEETLLDFFTNGENPNISGIYPNEYREPLDINALPWPEDDDIKRSDYYYIGGSDFREIEFFASRGCPMHCNYCVCGNLYYKPGRFNYRVRNVDDIINEIEYLRNKYPDMEGVFYDEEYHNFSKQFIIDLCEAKIKSGLNKLKYNAMCGYWTMDEEMLLKMKEAGYYKLRIGIETASQEALKGMHKNINLNKLKSLLILAKKLGIRMYGTFTFGSLGSTDAEDKKTLRFIKMCLKNNLLDEYQISICTPQPGTPFYNHLKNNNLLLTDDFSKYDGGTAVYSYPEYSYKQIESNCRKASRMYIRSRIFSRKVFFEIIKNLRKNGFLKTVKFGFSILINLFWHINGSSRQKN